MLYTPRGGGLWYSYYLLLVSLTPAASPWTRYFYIITVLEIARKKTHMTVYWSLSLSGGFTPCRHLGPCSGGKHTVV